MDLFSRSLNDPPDIETFRDRKPTLLVCWWCTLYAITIIIVRLYGRYIRAEKIFKEDSIMILAITPMLIRQVLVHFVLLYDTNNTKTDRLTDVDILRRKTGSQLVLASRIFYAASLWAIKYSVSIFLRSLTESVWQRSHQRLLRYLHIFLLVTLLATILSDLVACHPFTHYWQVVPDPGPQCRTGSANLFTTGILNIVTNLALVLFPLPMILKSRLTTRRKLTISLRLALPLLSAGFTAFAIPHIVAQHYSQAHRSLLASIEILLASAISSVIVLASILQDRGYKKTKYKHGAGREGFHVKGVKVVGGKGRVGGLWDSDEDLMGEGSGNGHGHGRVVGVKTGSMVELDDLGMKSQGNDGLKIPEQAKLQGIRVECQWEVQVSMEGEGEKK